MAATANAQTLTITISDMVMDEESMTDYCSGTDRSIAEGTTVRFDMMTWHTATGHIFQEHIWSKSATIQPEKW